MVLHVYIIIIIIKLVRSRSQEDIKLLGIMASDVALSEIDKFVPFREVGYHSNYY